MSDPNHASGQNPPPPPGGQVPPPYGTPPAQGDAPPSAVGGSGGYGQGAPTPPAYGSPYGDQAQPGAHPAYAANPAYGAPTSTPYGGYGGYPALGQTDPNRRPTTVTAGSIIAMVMSGITALGFGFVGLFFTAARDELVNELDPADLEGSGVSVDQVMDVMQWASWLVVLWCVIAIVLAGFALRRSNVARILLVVSSGVAGVISLLGFTSVVPLLWTAACIGTIVLMFTGGANQWYSRSGASPSSPGGYSQY